jgi:hypothetical protein
MIGRPTGGSSSTSTPESDGAATWPVSSPQTALRTAPDGLPTISNYILWRMLHDAGYNHQRR